MRPMRFESWLRDLIQQAGDPAVRSVQTNAETGLTRNRYGLTIALTSGSSVILQVLGQSRDGDKYDEPEQISESDTTLTPVPVPTLPTGGSIRTVAVEEWLYALICSSGNREFTGIERYSTAERTHAVRYGLTVQCHSGARIYLYVQHALRSGQSRETQKPYEVLESV